jgi:hypothetical protein
MFTGGPGSKHNRAPLWIASKPRRGLTLLEIFATPGQARVLGELSAGTLWLSIRLSSLKLGRCEEVL